MIVGSFFLTRIDVWKDLSQLKQTKWVAENWVKALVMFTKGVSDPQRGCREQARASNLEERGRIAEAKDELFA